MLVFKRQKNGPPPTAYHPPKSTTRAAHVDTRSEPGETRAVRLCVGPDALPLVDDAGKARVLPGEYTVSAGVAGGVGGAGAGGVIGTIVIAP